MKNGKFLAGIIAGLGTGAILGILFAPDKGSKTRKRILKECNPSMRKSKQKLQQQEDTDLVNSVM